MERIVLFSDNCIMVVNFGVSRFLVASLHGKFYSFSLKKTQDKTAVVAKIEISTEAESIDSSYYFREKVRSYIF